MNKLYLLAYKRVLHRLAAQEARSANLASVLEQNSIKPIGSHLFRRFPKDEIKNFVANPCPVTKYPVPNAVWSQSRASRSYGPPNP